MTTLTPNPVELTVDVKVAQAVGLHEAMILQAFRLLTDDPTKIRHRDEADYVQWSAEEIRREAFPFWSVRVIRKVISSLESQGVLASVRSTDYGTDNGCPKYYRILYFHLNILLGDLKLPQVAGVHFTDPRDLILDNKHQKDVVIKAKDTNTNIYLMKDHHNGLVKIGRSVNPTTRGRTLQSQKPSIEMMCYWKADRRVESKLHEQYADKRIRGEWFKLTESDVSDIKQQYCQ